MYLTAGYNRCVLKYGEKSCMGRLGKLTHDEVTALKTYFADVCAEGACVDRECIAILAMDLVAKNRPHLCHPKISPGESYCGALY